MPSILCDPSDHLLMRVLLSSRTYNQKYLGVAQSRLSFLFRRRQDVDILSFCRPSYLRRFPLKCRLGFSAAIRPPAFADHGGWVPFLDFASFTRPGGYRRA